MQLSRKTFTSFPGQLYLGIPDQVGNDEHDY